MAGGNGPVAAFVRFVVCGGGVTLLGSGALLLVGDRVPIAAANAVVAVVTTLLATELHGRVTFRRGRASWRDHAASGLTVLLSYLFTTGALLAFDALRPGGGALLRQGVYLAASGAAGIARFLLLRCVVFARPLPQAGPAARSTARSRSRLPVRVVPVQVVPVQVVPVRVPRAPLARDAMARVPAVPEPTVPGSTGPVSPVPGSAEQASAVPVPAVPGFERRGRDGRGGRVPVVRVPSPRTARPAGGPLVGRAPIAFRDATP